MAQAPAHRGANRPSNMLFWPVPDRPFVERGRGIHVWDQDGKRYIDASAGPQTCNIGHGNERVRQVMLAQAEKISFAFRSHFRNEPAEDLADLMAELAPEGLDRAFFCSGGSEAVEAAIKLARQHAVAIGQGSRYKMISRLPAYHGSTLGALACTGDPMMAGPFAPMMTIWPKIPAPFSAYRLAGQSLAESGLEYADMLEREIVAQGPESVLAFIMETIGGASTGALVAPDSYYARVRQICDKYGVLLILDEVMCGAGRTGTFLAAEHWNLTPDIVVLAKGLASGYVPFGAIMTSAGIADAIDAAGGYIHAHTYSASPLACAVAGAVIQEHLDHDLWGNAGRTGAYFMAQLQTLLDEFPFIGEVRGRGLMLGFDVIADRATGKPLPNQLNAHQRIVQEAYDRGLIIYSRRVLEGAYGDFFLLTPPLIITEAEVDEVMELLKQALRAFAPEAQAAGEA